MNVVEDKVALMFKSQGEEGAQLRITLTSLEDRLHKEHILQTPAELIVPGGQLVRIESTNPAIHIKHGGYTHPTPYLFQARRSERIQLLNTQAEGGETIASAEDIPCSLHPNPASTTLHLLSPSPGRYSIHSLAGHAMLHGNLTSHTNQIDIQQLPQGAYVLRAVFGNRTQVHRFVKR